MNEENGTTLDSSTMAATEPAAAPAAGETGISTAPEVDVESVARLVSEKLAALGTTDGGADTPGTAEPAAGEIPPKEEKASPEPEAPTENLAEENKRLKAELAAKALKDTALVKLGENNLPASLADILDYSSETALTSSFEKVQTAFAAAVTERLRGQTPPGLGGGSNEKAALTAQVRASVRG